MDPIWYSRKIERIDEYVIEMDNMEMENMEKSAPYKRENVRSLQGSY